MVMYDMKYKMVPNMTAKMIFSSISSYYTVKTLLLILLIPSLNAIFLKLVAPESQITRTSMIVSKRVPKLIFSMTNT